MKTDLSSFTALFYVYNLNIINDDEMFLIARQLCDILKV